jgi:hypothetical protein
MGEYIMHIIDIALPIVLGYVVWLLKEERKERQEEIKERKATNLGMKEILGYMIDRWFEEFCIQGYVTTDQRNTFEGVFKAYAANGGNGAREAKWHEVEKMHIDDTKSGRSPYLELLIQQSQKTKTKKKPKEGTSL